MLDFFLEQETLLQQHLSTDCVAAVVGVTRKGYCSGTAVAAGNAGRCSSFAPSREEGSFFRTPPSDISVVDGRKSMSQHLMNEAAFLEAEAGWMQTLSLAQNMSIAIEGLENAMIAATFGTFEDVKAQTTFETRTLPW